MKQFIKHRVILISFVAVSLFAGCEKSDSSYLYGDSYIFIPQSNVSGGVNLHYLVPTGADVNTYNYKIDIPTNSVNILLGLNRSGMEAYSAFSVTVATRSDTINQLIANGKINLTTSAKPVVLLPSAEYTLPATVSVPAGLASTSFNLTISIPVLKTYAGKKVALCVAISNPTLYRLSPAYNKVIVLVDVDALKLP